jgi:hypothetical protein
MENQNRIKQNLLAVFFILGLVFSFAQDFTASLSSNKVHIGEQVRVTYAFTSKPSSFKPPSFPGFQIVGGPNQSSRISNVNGHVTRSVSYSYVLTPTKKGKFTFKPATAKIDGNSAASNSLSIQVLEETAERKSINTQLKDLVYFKSFSSNNKPYIGESVVITNKLYIHEKINLMDHELDELGKISGFWTKNLLSNKPAQPKREEINGQRFVVYEIGKYLLIPQKYGKTNLKQLTLKCNVGIPTNQVDFFGRRQRRPHPFSTKSPLIVLNVRDIPNKPKDFIGAVGDFEFNIKISKDTASVNETISLTQSVKGKGNLKLFSLPKIDIPSDIESFEPKQNDKISAHAGGMVGKKENQYVLVPRYPGKHKIKIPAFSYFDTKKKKIIQVEEQLFELNVKDENNSFTARNENLANTPDIREKTEVDVLSDSILFIKEKTSFQHPKTRFYLSTSFWILLLLPVIGLIVFLFVRKQMAVRNGDVVAIKKKRAKSLAQKRLKEASKYLSTDEKKEFYTVLSTSLFGYIKDKLNIDNSELQTEIIQQKLTEKGVQPEIIEEFSNIISICQMANYGGYSDSEKPNMMARSEKLIQNLEEGIVQ